SQRIDGRATLIIERLEERARLRLNGRIVMRRHGFLLALRPSRADARSLQLRPRSGVPARRRLPPHRWARSAQKAARRSYPGLPRDLAPPSLGFLGPSVKWRRTPHKGDADAR